MDMLGKEGMVRAWSQIYAQFIKPEIEERCGIAWSDIHKVLIKLPKDRDPIVEFNNEISFIYTMEDPVERNAGAKIEFYEIREIKEIIPPKVDDRCVAFIYAWRKRDQIYFVFDFRPNGPDFDEESHAIEGVIRFRLECELLEHVLIPPIIRSENKLLELGVSIFPALIPYPLNVLVKHQLEGDTNTALRIMEEHCDVDFIKQQMEIWYTLNIFEERQTLFDEALQAHSLGLHHAAINALIGQPEGIITDWLYRHGEASIPWRINSKFDEFQRLMESVVPLEAVEQLILQSLGRFLVSPDTMLQTFSEWNNPALNADSVSRHVIQHGKYVPEYYTKANSIKMFLVLDSICWCIQCYENYKNEIHSN